MLTIRIQGGTNAGRRAPSKELQAWTCTRGHANKPYASTCLHRGCRERRKP